MNAGSQTRPYWLWIGYPGDDLHNSWVQCRKTVHLQSAPSSAIVHVTADTKYRLFVNGQRVGDGPCRGFQDQWPYDSIDIAPYLTAGENVIAILAHNLGIGTHSYIHQGWGGVLLWGMLGDTPIRTDNTWRVRACPEHLRYLTRVSIQMGWQEFIDSRRSDGDWTRSGYDDSFWPPTSFHGARPSGSPPWHNLVPRDIPLLRELILAPAKLASTATGPAGENWRDTTNVVRFHTAHPLAWKPASGETSAWIKPSETHSPACAWCFDFQREVCASLILEVRNARGGETIDLLVTEGIDGSEPVFHPDKGCSMQFGARVICAPGNRTVETFTPWGFRYVAAVVRGAEDSDIELRLSARHVEYPLERQGRIVSSSDTLTNIYEMCAHTQQLCMLDTYVDCPSREQAMWWGDAHCHFDNSQRLAADDRLFVRGLRLLAKQSLPNGLLYAHAPTKAYECVLPDFVLMWIETLWQHYWYSGSPALFGEHRQQVRRALSYFEQQVNPNGLLPLDDRYWLFLDWAETFKDGYSTLYNQQYLRTLELASTMYDLLGDPAAETLRKRAADLRETITRRLWDAANTAPLDGLTWEEQPVSARSLHNRVMALRNDLFPEHHTSFLQDHLLPFVRGLKPAGCSPYKAPDPRADRRALTPYFMQFTFEVLARAGYGKDVISCIERWWGDMLRRDLKTTEEVWDSVPGLDSVCHAWTSHPIHWLSNLLLGVRQTAPGWRQITFAPVFYGEHAQGTVATPLGPITASWKRQAGHVEIELALPEGCIARLDLPGVPAQQVIGRWRGTCSNG